MGFLEVLALILIALKLLGVISISWVWVLSPIWASLVIYTLMFTVVILFIRGKRKRRGR